LGSDRFSNFEDYVTKSIIDSRILGFRTPLHVVVANTIDFCLVTAINLIFSNLPKTID